MLYMHARLVKAGTTCLQEGGSGTCRIRCMLEAAGACMHASKTDVFVSTFVENRVCPEGSAASGRKRTVIVTVICLKPVKACCGHKTQYIICISGVCLSRESLQQCNGFATATDPAFVQSSSRRAQVTTHLLLRFCVDHRVLRWP
jgi:hypothetical protein